MRTVIYAEFKPYLLSWPNFYPWGYTGIIVRALTHDLLTSLSGFRFTDDSSFSGLVQFQSMVLKKQTTNQQTNEFPTGYTILPLDEALVKLDPNYQLQIRGNVY